jgi:hypothetical protein
MERPAREDVGRSSRRLVGGCQLGFELARVVCGVIGKRSIMVLAGFRSGGFRCDTEFLRHFIQFSPCFARLV